MSVPAWIIFDIGGVVIKLNGDFALTQLAEKSRTPEARLSEIFQEKYHDLSDLSPHERFQIGKIEEDAYLAWIQSQLNEAISIDEIRAIRLKVLNGEDAQTCALITDLSRNHGVACFSNTHSLHWNYMTENYPIFKQFKFCLASHIAGVAKPFREAYQYMCDSLSTTPQNCVFVDDNKVNVASAKSFGMEAVFFQNAKTLRNDLIGLGYKI